MEERLEEGSGELLPLCFGFESPARTASPLMYVFDHGGLLMLFTAAIIAVAFLYLALLLAFLNVDISLFFCKQANATTAVSKFRVSTTFVTSSELESFRAERYSSKEPEREKKLMLRNNYTCIERIGSQSLETPQ